MSDLRDDIQAAINRHSAESSSNTPDCILADYLIACLTAFDATTGQRWCASRGLLLDDGLLVLAAPAAAELLPVPLACPTDLTALHWGYVTWPGTGNNVV